MLSRRLLRLALASAVVVAGLAVSTPAPATVTYDPQTQTGFVDLSDVREAFGWTDEVLTLRAADIGFGQSFWTDDNYSVSCGDRVFAIAHKRVSGRYDLTDVLARDRGRGAAGYGGKLLGFRITGSVSGISGTSMPPTVGQPCPDDRAPDATISSARLVSTVTGWALVAEYRGAGRELLVRRTPQLF